VGAEEICYLPATELARAMAHGELSAREVLAAHCEQYERWNPIVNAIVTTTFERAGEQARAADEAHARGEALGPLHGLPIAHKDLVDTAGVRTTYGSPIFADNVPEVDEPLVMHIREAGAILMGKTNTPEFGTGSHTFNPVFGVTRNPYDPSVSAGGSSGGAAAALACGMVPIADGSDLGGSLRNPASFCNVVGFRPTLVPEEDALDLSMDGPMARTVDDVALLHGVMTGGDWAIAEGGVEASAVAWAPSFGGAVPVEPVVAATIESARAVVEGLGCDVIDAAPDLGGAREAFLTLRARSYAQNLGDLLAQHRDEMKPTLVWNIEQGFDLTGDDVERAVARRDEVRAAAAAFFATYDVLVVPVSQVPPFDVDLEYPTQVAGIRMATYLDWMESCWSITVLGAPAISVPCGFTDDGLPIGMQIVGKPGADAAVLRFARAFERATEVGAIRPTAPAPDPRRPAT